MTTVVSVAQSGTGANSAALARTALGVPPSAAYDQANTARDQANTARTQANSAYAQANSAYSDANTRLSASGGTLAGDLIITGNLTVSGNQTILNTEVLTTEDADIVLLSNTAGTPALNAGLIINRGTSTNTFLRWNEVTDKWGYSDDGTTFYSYDDIRSGLVTTNTTFGTVNTNITNTNSNAINAYAQANAAYGQANSARSDANTTFATINTTTATMNTATSNRVLKAGDTMTGTLNISAGGLVVWASSGTSQVNVVEVKNLTNNGYLSVSAAGNASAVATWSNGSMILEGVPASTGDTILSSFTGRLLFQTSSRSNRLVIDSSGNVGIGTTSPISKTTITKAVTNTVTLADSNNASHLTLAGSDALVRLQLGCGGSSLGYAGWIQASYDNTGGAFGVEALLLNPSGGDVGIGTTTPTTVLTLRKAIDSSAYGSGTRMLDFKSYYPGYDTETVKASIYAWVS